jgi:hypothetical protein
MKRMVMVMGLIGLVVLVLAAGAFTAVRLLTEPEAEAAASGGGRVMQSVRVDNGGQPVSVQTTILPATELPGEEPVASGVVQGREDDTLKVGTGNIDLVVDVEVDASTGEEKASVAASTDGPELEIVLTRDTLLYRDVTDIAGQMPDDSGEVTIRQEVRPVTDSGEIEENMEIQVWGERRGDRVVATAVVFGPLAGGAFE